jgi:hypothetical protein
MGRVTRAQLIEGDRSAGATDARTLAQTGRPERQFQELWFTLARRGWRSLSIVPADEGLACTEIGRSLAEVGRLLDERVTLFGMSKNLDFPSASQAVAGAAPSHPGPPSRFDESPGKVIVALPPVVSEPLGVAVATASDLVVLCVRLGRSRVAAARRTIELIGRERIAGCLIVR